MIDPPMSLPIFVLVSAVAAHLAFSRFGFNPTDEGFILAGSRRLLDGQIPHRDFVSVRPVLSLVLHLPELILGRGRCLMASRFVFWLQMAGFSAVWASLLDTQQPVVYALMILALSVQVFPPMAWHTVDALLLASAGVLLLPSGWGFLLIGMSVLCRQNFVLLVPLALIFGFSARVLWAVLPAAVYLGATAFVGATPHLLRQIRAYHGRTSAFIGLKKFLNPWTIAGLTIGALVSVLGWNGLLAGAPVLFAAMVAIRGVPDWPAYLAFGLALPGVLLQLQPVPVFLVGLAWVSSLSIGYRYPALMLGPLCVIIVHTAAPPPLLALGLTLIAAGLIVVARLRHVYGDEPAWKLKSQLGEVLQGGRGVRTSAGTYRFLQDLNVARERALQVGDRYAVVPDVAANWMMSKQRNPLSCDWPQDTELGRPGLVKRLIDEAQDPALVVIAQKYRARSAHLGKVPFNPPPTILEALWTGPNLVGTTEFFDLYRARPGRVPNCG